MVFTLDIYRATDNSLFIISKHSRQSVLSLNKTFDHFLKCHLEMSKIAIFFPLFHDHTKHKLWSFTIREDTFLLLPNKFCITWHTREKIS